MDELTVVFTSFPDFSGNSKSLYEYMARKYKKMRLVWAVGDESLMLSLSKRDIECVYIGSDDFNNLLNRADVLFDTHGQFSAYDTDNKLYINLWHGIPMKKIGYLLDDKDLSENDKVFLNNVSTKTDYLTTPSPFCSSILATAFDINIKKVLTLGMPRLDDLYNGTKKNKFEKLIKCKADNFDKVIIYLPTFRSGCGRDEDGFMSSSNIINLEKYDEKRLVSFLSKNNYLLLIKYHPSESSNIIKIESQNIIYLDDILLKNQDITLNEILSYTDLLITDYSSIYIDYMLLDKPIIFIDTDIDFFAQNRGLIYDNKNLWFPGPMVKEFKCFTAELSKLINNHNYFLKERNQFKKLMYKNSDDNSKRLCDFLFDGNSLSTSCILALEAKKSKKFNEKLADQTIINLEEKLNKIYNSKAYRVYSVARQAKNIITKR